MTSITSRAMYTPTMIVWGTLHAMQECQQTILNEPTMQLTRPLYCRSFARRERPQGGSVNFSLWNNSCMYKYVTYWIWTASSPTDTVQIIANVRQQLHKHADIVININSWACSLEKHQYILGIELTNRLKKVTPAISAISIVHTVLIPRQLYIQLIYYNLFVTRRKLTWRLELQF